MNSATIPIFIIEDADVSVYASVKSAEIDLEPIDVKTGGFVAYDAEGRLLQLKTNGWRVTISLAEERPTHAHELEVTLRNFLESTNDPIAHDSACDLDCLVNTCRRFISTTPRASDILKAAWVKMLSIFPK